MSLSSFLHIVKWFQVLLYNTHNLTSVICLHTVCSIWPIDRTLSGATSPGQSEPESNDNERVLHILQIFKAGTLSSDGLIPYPGHFWRDAVSVFYCRLGCTSSEYIYIYIYTHTYMHTSTHIHTHTHTHIYIHAYICIHTKWIKVHSLVPVGHSP